MSWIKYAVAGIALCVGASAASAQSAPPAEAPPMGGQRGQRGGEQAGRRGMQAMLFQDIDLTDAQKSQVQEIRAKYREPTQALMANGRPDGPMDKGMRDKMEDIQEKQNKEIRAVLTEDQRKVFDKNLDAMKKRREEMEKQRGSEGR